MDGLKVSELARRTGVPATTLRFYEQHGLLTPRRSPSGYRLFDQDAVDQLRFIGTAKNLGLSLDDIRLLLRPWQREGCREVQRALAPMLDQRSADAREQIIALQEFAARLDEARRLLDGIDRDGPCDSSCNFLAQENRAGPKGARPVEVTVSVREPRKDAGEEDAGEEDAVDASPEVVPETAGAACSLPAPSWRGRWARWSRVLAHATSRERRDDRVRVEFAPTILVEGGIVELVELVRAEQSCCPSLDTSLVVGAGIVVEALLPNAEALNVAEALFGPLTVGADPADTPTLIGAPAVGHG